MRFRRISEDISESEIKMVLEMIFESSVRLVRYERRIEYNYVEVFFKLLSDDFVHRIDLLPDNVYNMDGGNGHDEEFQDGNINWEYMKFAVARGYSELWVNNRYMEK